MFEDVVPLMPFSIFLESCVSSKYSAAMTVLTLRSTMKRHEKEVSVARTLFFAPHV